jgi:hypothetical protein
VPPTSLHALTPPPVPSPGLTCAACPGLQVQELVKPFCAKHGIPYHSTNLWVGTKEVLQHLGKVTQDLMRDFPAM